MLSMSKFRLSILLFVLSSTGSAFAQSLPELIDPFVETVFKQLATNQKLNRVNAPDEDAVKFGTAYFVDSDEISCYRQFRQSAIAGNPVTIVSFIEFDAMKLPKPRVVKDWRSIRLSSLLTQGALGEISAKLPGRSADISAAADAIKKSNAQILFATVSVPQYPYQVAAQSELKDKGITDVADFAPGASGVVTPVSILVVQKFEYDKEIIERAQLSFGAQFLQLFGLRIAGDQSKAIFEGFKFPTNSAAAFVPALVQFKNLTCE